ncbi:MAG: GEVED domain-containing protein, partial [Flavobacteriia bacterium]
GSVNGGATNPDIGADEFDATPIFAPSITLGSITPINCTTASSHPVSVTATPGSGTMTSVVLNYAFNGVAQTPITMTNTSGSTYEATIPAATPVNATVTWSVTATNSFSLPITYTGAAYQDQSLLGVTAVANNSLSPVCAGSPSNLSVILSGLAAPNYTLPVVTQALFDEDLGTVVISQGGVDIINNVSVINSLNGTIGTATGTAGSYSNYTAFGPYTLNAGQTYNFSLSSLTTGTAYLNHMRIYIDLNRNGSFADAGECMYFPAANVSGAHTETGSFTIPASAFNGLTRMRVFCYEGAPAAAYINTFGYGEFEDYMINMVSTNSGGGFVPAITSASWSDGTTTLGTGNPYTINPTSTAT